MIILFILLINKTYSYSWSLDFINQNLYFPDFLIKRNNYQTKTDIFIIDTGITNNTNFYNNIVETQNFINNISFDENGHGTFITSIISSKKYGITKNTNIHSLKVFDNQNATKTIYILNALKYVKTQCKNKKCIINLSIGLDGINNNLDNVLNDLYKDNIIIVAAAGNSNQNCNNFTPSRLPNLLVVGSVDYMNYKSSFSNYGECVDIYSYGEIVPGLGLYNNFYINFGTSFSAPMITGYISDFWLENENLNNSQVIKMFLDKYSIKHNNINIFKINENYIHDIVIISFFNIVFFVIYLIFKLI